MSQRVASNAVVSDEELLAAVEQADGTCLNGLPDAPAVAAECDLTCQRIKDRLRDLVDRGHVEQYQSKRLNLAGTCNSYQAVVDPDALEGSE